MLKDYPPFFNTSIDASDCIYHYSDFEKVLKILPGETIRMTNIRYLNDWMEGRYFYDPLIKLIGKNSKHADKLKTIYEKCLKNTYVACFCMTPNLLSQYKYYGNICLGFNTSLLDNDRRILNDNPTSGFETNKKVNYCSIEEYKNVLEKFSTDKDLIEGVIKEDIYSILKFFSFIADLKHPGFSEENESRLYHFWYEPKIVEYNFYDGRNVPYMNFKFSPSTIKTIIIGPNSMQNKIAVDLQEYKEKNKAYKHIDIYRSDIPFIPK